MHTRPHSPRAGSLLRFAFNQLYTHAAWAYDAVAAAVSFGEWQQWGRAVIPFLPAQARLLEIGHGPGHLNLTLRQQGWSIAGIDLSPQMSVMARRRLSRARLDITLARASAGQLPFHDASFGAVISTFPTDYIYSQQVLAEIRRVLSPGSRLVIVPDAPLRTSGPTGLLAHLVKTAYRVGRGSDEAHLERDIFARAGYTFAEYRAPARYAVVIVWVCEKME